MLAVFEKSVGKPPKEPSLPVVGRNCLTAWKKLQKSCDHGDQTAPFTTSPVVTCWLCHIRMKIKQFIPRSIVVMDDIFCILSGAFHNTCYMRQRYGLSRQATEAMIIVEAYKVLRDRAPYPPDQVAKELDGRFAFTIRLQSFHPFPSEGSLW